MPTLTWKDNRLPANDVAPWDTTIMFVSPATPLGEMVSDSEQWCLQYYQSSSMDLMIYCHGSPGSLLICDENITLGNMYKLASLKPYFDTVSIHACLVAKGDTGRAFCSRLAAVLVAPVAGAVSLQYNTGVQTLYGQIDDRKYDGDYYIHDASGARSGPLRSP